MVFGVLVPVAGLMGDKISKKRLIIISLLVWSAATLCTGFSTTLFELIILRSVATGGGEAFYSPSANALISENHSDKTRATALSIHQTALYIGIIFSGYLAGAVAEAWGWRHAFVLFGGFGILLGIILIFRIKKDKRAQEDSSGKIETSTIGESIGAFFKRPTAILLALALACMQFVGVGFITWMPTYLHETFSFDLARSGFDATFWHHAGAFAGVLLGARIADSLSRNNYHSRTLTQCAGLLLGAPFIFLMAKSNTIIVIYLAMTMFGIFRGMYDSNLFASVYDVIPERCRAAATGFMQMFAFIVGSISPYLLGLIKPGLGLSNGMAALAFVYLLGAILIFCASMFTLKKDIAKITS